MRLITKQYMINIVATRFKANYFRRERGWMVIPAFDTEQMFATLSSLENPSEQDIIALIGPSWTAITCDHCNKDVELAVDIDVTYGEQSTTICKDCLQSALDLANSKSDGRLYEQAR